MFTLLTFAALLKVLPAFNLEDGYSTWEVECHTSGISSHPADCRAFALCQTDDVQLYTCPPQSGYSQKHHTCLPLLLLPNNCGLQPELDDEKFLKLMPELHNKSSNVPVCNPQGQLLGFLQCGEHSDVSQERCTAASKTCLTAKSRKSATLIAKQEIQLQNLSRETERISLKNSPAISELLATGASLLKEKDVEEEFPPVVCKQKGLHCADDSTLADCSDISEEPLFSMSCSSLIHDDSGAHTRGYCEDAVCILSTKGLSLQLPLIEFSVDDPDVPEEFLKECSEHVGLRCVDNQTLVACAGNLDTTNYAISCSGNSSDIGLQGYCHEDTDSCIFLTPEERTSGLGNNAHNVTSVSNGNKVHKYNKASDVVREDLGTSLLLLRVLSQGFPNNLPHLSLLRGSHTSNKS